MGSAMRGYSRKLRAPRTAEGLLRMVLVAEDRDFILGDLAEQFGLRVLEDGRARSLGWYWRQVGQSLRPSLRRRLDVRRSRRERRHAQWKGDGSPGFTSPNKGRAPMFEQLGQDIRYGVRTLLREPGWTAAAVFTLALAIGATSAIFSLVSGILLQPLPYDDPDQLVEIQFMPAGSEAQDAFGVMSARDQRWSRYNVTYPNFETWRNSTTDVFDDIAAYDDNWRFTVGFGDGSERLLGTWASASLFRILRAQPLLGRTFTDEEDEPGSAGVVILSHKLWQRKFAGSSDAIGQTLPINERPHTIVGVMSAGFDFPNPDVEFWRPMADAEQGVRATNYEVVGRLAPGVSLERARVLLGERAVTLVVGDGESEQWTSGVLSLHDYMVGDVRPLLLVFLAAVAAVLLIACVNVVNLMLTRAAGREKEHVVRAAMGAGRRRLAQQLLTESMLVSLASGLVGVGLAAILTRALIALSPGSVPRQDLVGIDMGVLAFTFTVAICVGLAVGVMPAMRASRTDLAAGLNTSARGSSGAVRHNRVRDGLVVAQVGLALTLVVCAGLLLKSFSGMLAIERGFDSTNVLAFETTLSSSRYPTFEDRVRFYDELIAGVEAMPGVRSAAIAVYIPATGWFHSMDFDAPRYQRAADEVLVGEFKEVSPGYFATLGVRLVDGRLFEDRDNRSSPPSAIINEAMARRYWPDGDAVGSAMTISPGSENERTTTVVGIVDDVRLRAGGRLRGQEEDYQIYVPYNAWGASRSMDVLARTDIRPQELVPSMRRLLASMDPEVVVYNIGTVEDLLSARISEPRFRTLLIGAFGMAALVLAMVGVYGVMAYAVAQRTREMGIRMALGAQGGRIMKEVFLRGLVLTLFGLGFGLAGAWVATSLLEGYMYQLDVHDPLTFALAVLLLAASALLACVLPARRAARVDPMIALRAE